MATRSISKQPILGSSHNKTIVKITSVKELLSSLHLPMIDFAKNIHRSTNLQGVYLVAQQHIVPTLIPTIQALIDLGLDPENISLIGKCYSTDSTTFHVLDKAGLHICKTSLTFESSVSFDDFYSKNINCFLRLTIERIKNKKPKKIVILDDGGDLLLKFNDLCTDLELPCIGIEQTSSGYNKIVGQDLNFPVINLARSEVKLKYESPIVAELALNRIFDRISSKKVKKILVIGGGSIGFEIYSSLASSFDVKIYDKNPMKSMLSNTQFERFLNEVDLIIGCTGDQALSQEHLKNLKKDVILVSNSSSDREFNAVNFRQQVSKIVDCHQDLYLNSIHLLNCGFPITFDSKYDLNDQMLLIKFQLTRSLILSSICQANDALNAPLKFIDFDKKIQKKIINNYLSLYPMSFASKYRYAI